MVNFLGFHSILFLSQVHPDTRTGSIWTMQYNTGPYAPLNPFVLQVVDVQQPQGCRPPSY